MKELKKRLQFYVEHSKGDHSVIDAIMSEESVPPFSAENRLMAYLLSLGELSFADYEDLHRSFIKRHSEENKYIDLFEMAPRVFGQTWGEQHIRKLFPQFIKATKENLSSVYPDFDGEFDLWYKGIRIEVKACRANSPNAKGSLSSRAYSHDEAGKNHFKYHFQQLKPSCCDVFIWIGVCKNELIYWVLTSEELRKTGKLCSQHRNENTGTAAAEVFEGQVFMTENELKSFLVEEKDILSRVIKKGAEINFLRP